MQEQENRVNAEETRKTGASKAESLAAVEIKELTFSYRGNPEVKAVEGINLTIEKGEFLVIMGPSGAGKSTLANSLNGLIPSFMKGKYEGEVRVAGEKVKGKGVSTMARKIGLVFQDFEAQLFSTNVNLEIAFGPENFSVPRQEIHQRIEKVLETVKLKGFEERQPATLSGGQKQRLAIGSVLATYPDIICMDEPTTDLDPLGKLGIFSIAKELHKSSDFTLIIIEHETEEALHANRLVIMKDGKIIRQGKPADLLRDVAFTDSIGIMPLQVPKFFMEYLHKQPEELPVGPEDGLAYFRKQQLEIDGEKYRQLLEAEEKRRQNYGEMVLSVRDLVHVYPNGNRAVDGISLDIQDREFIAILGHNGSGKTTLVKHFNALLAPTEGQVVIYGKNTREHSIFEIGKEIGYVFQNPDHQIFSDTVCDEVAFSPKIRGCAEEEIQQRVTEALEAVELKGYEKEDPFSLSKGERQRVALAAILAAEPKVILLDEPTRGMHPREVDALVSALRDLREEPGTRGGNTVVVVEHDPAVMAAADHLIDMGPGAGALGGEIVAQGPPERVREGDAVTARWLRGERRADVHRPRRAPREWMAISGATVSSQAVVTILNTYVVPIQEALKQRGLIE